MKEKMFVAIYKVNDTLVNVCGRNSSDTYENRLQECKEYEEIGGKLVSCIFTNNETVFYKARLKAMLIELKDYVKTSAEWLEYVKATSTPEVVEQTEILINEHIETLMNKVAIRCSSLLLRDIPITDELALQCYDFRQKRLA